MPALSIIVTALVVVGLLGLAYRSLRARTVLSLRLLLLMSGVGAVAALLCLWLELWLWRFTGLEPVVVPGNTTGALIAVMLVAVPLEEASKLISAWPLYQRGRLVGRADGIMVTLSVAAGFAVSEVVFTALTSGVSGLDVVRAVLGSIAHLFFAAAWGYTLTDVSEGRWLRRAWFVAVVFHGLFDHIVYGRAAGTMVLSGPLIIAMIGLAWLGIRQARRPPQLILEPDDDDIPLELIRKVVQRRDQPVKFRWIIVGAFVTTGVALTALGLAIYLGHQIGVDFAAADEADVSANAPLLLLGSATLLAFPVAGYLVARASATDSVLEPALGAAASIVIVVILLSMAAPVAIVFSLAVAPVAFGLACLGAWFGMGK